MADPLATIRKALEDILIGCRYEGNHDAVYDALAAVREEKRREAVRVENLRDANYRCRVLAERAAAAEARVAELERALDDTWADVSVLLDQHVSGEVDSEAWRRLIGRAAAREDVSSIDTEYADTHRALRSETKDALNIAVERAEIAENTRRKLRWRRVRGEATGEPSLSEIAERFVAEHGETLRKLSDDSD